MKLIIGTEKYRTLTVNLIELKGIEKERRGIGKDRLCFVGISNVAGF